MLQSNQRISEYVLDERVGQSAYDESWRAHHHMWTDQLALVKIPTDPGYLNNLRRQGIKLQRLAHPNIVRPIGFDPTAEPPYLMIEFVGSSLRVQLDKGRLTVNQSLNILRQVLSALRYGHERGVVHGDVKPENILLEDGSAAGDFAMEGCVKVSDFGIGIAAAATTAGDAAAKAQPTSSTMAYVSPEQRDGAAPDAKSDIYAVGVVLFEMLTGERPSGADMPSELNSQVPPWLDAAFRKSYARRERRFESAAAFLAALTPTPAPVAPVAPPPPAPVYVDPEDQPIPIAREPADFAPAAPTTPRFNISPQSSAIPGSDAPTVPPPSRISIKPAPMGEGPKRERNIFTNEKAPAEDLTGAKVIGFRDEEEEHSPRRTSSPEPEPTEEDASGDIIDLAPQKASPPPPPAFNPGLAALEEAISSDTKLKSAAKSAPAKADKSSSTTFSGTSAKGDKSGDTAVPAPTGPAPINIAKVPSRAERDMIFDELGKRQIRSLEDICASVTSPEIRKLDEGETANIRLRLIKWANSLAGGQSDLDDQIEIVSAVSQPLRVIHLVVRSNTGNEPLQKVTMDHPAASLADANLQPTDYRPMVHLSADVLNEKLLEAIPDKDLRVLLLTTARTTRRELVGRIVREDLLIYIADVIVITYKFDDRQYQTFMMGDILTIAAAEEPFSKIRQEPTKRAALLLETDKVPSGLKELRRAMTTPQWESKAMAIMGSLRGKLAAAYLEEASQQYRSVGLMESVEFASKAAQLAPGKPEAFQHVARVRKTMLAVQFIPGLIVAGVFISLAIAWGIQPDPNATVPPNFRDTLSKIVANPFLVAGLGALVATLWSGFSLGMRIARTEVVFLQSLLLPTAIACVVAPAPQGFRNPSGDLLCAVALVAVIAIDTLIFKKFRAQLIRQDQDVELRGDGTAVLNKIEALVLPDWDRIKPHYVKLGPLFSFSSKAATASPPIVVKEEEPAPSPPRAAAIPRVSPGATKAGSKAGTKAGSKSGSTTGGPGIPRSSPTQESDEQSERMVEQMEARSNAAAKALIPTTRGLIEVIAAYVEAQKNDQGLEMQSSAAKIELRGKELAGKLSEFQRLCRTPLTVDSADARLQGASLAGRMEDPDIKLLGALASRASLFRNNEIDAIAELAGNIPEANKALDRIRDW